MISPDQINDRKDSGSTSGFGEGVDMGERIPIVLGAHVKATVIATRAPSAVRLGHDMER